MSGRKCTAPVTGRHNSAATSAKCPVHGRQPVTRGESPFPEFVAAAEARLRVMDVASAKRRRAGDPDTPPEELHTLVLEEIDGGSGYSDIRLAVAGNSATAIETLRLLAVSSVRDVRVGVSRNPNVAADVLTLMVEDEDHAVRRNVADNPNTPAEALVLLARPDDFLVHNAVTRNPNTPDEVAVGLLSADSAFSGIARECVDERICARFGVDPVNTAAVRALGDIPRWWTLAPDSDDVAITLALHPEPE